MTRRLLSGPVRPLPASARGRVIFFTLQSALLLLFVVRLFSVIPGNSATYDEPVHITRGYAAVRLHDFRLNIEHPVLGDALAALPLRFVRGIHFPVTSRAWQTAYHWIIADEFVFHSNAHPQLLIEIARGSVAVMAAVLAALVAMWSAQLYGWRGSLISTFLFTFCPNILANSSVATNDLAVTAFSTLYLWLLWRYTLAPGAGRLAAAAVGLGAALLCKYSAMVLLIDTVLLFGLWVYQARGAGVRTAGGVAAGSARDRSGDSTADRSGDSTSDRSGMPASGLFSAACPAASQVVRDGVLLFVGAGLVIWAAYGFRVQPLATATVMHQEVGESFGDFIRGRVERPDNQPIHSTDIFWGTPLPHNRRWHLMTGIPVPAPQYVRGFMQNWMQARGGHRAFLMGRVSREGWWYYFPVAFALKTPIPYLLLMAAALATLGLGWEWGECFLLIPAAVLWAAAMKAHIDIGIRHLLPVYPLAALFCGRLAPALLRLPGRANVGRAALATLCVWMAIESAAIHPFYLTYFNELAGGPDRASRYLVDSNLDWGQDLERLQCALAAHHVVNVALAYFGTADPGAYGIQFQPLPLDPAKPLPGNRPPTAGWVAASVSELAYNGAPGQGLYWLRGYQPRFTVGHTIRVYHIAAPPVLPPQHLKWLHSDQLME